MHIMNYSTVFASHFVPLIYYNVNFLNRLFDPWLLSAGPTLPVRGCVPDSGRPCPCRLPRHCVRRRLGRRHQGHHRQRYSPSIPPTLRPPPFWRFGEENMCRLLVHQKTFVYPKPSILPRQSYLFSLVWYAIEDGTSLQPSFPQISSLF